MIAGARRGLLVVASHLTVAMGAAAAQPPPDTVPYVPTAMPVVAAMLEMADLGRGDVLYDLGSGDGRIVISAARRYGTRGVGFEIDPGLVAASRAAAASAGLDSVVTFTRQDLFEADIAPASVVALYLSPELNLQLRPKLLAELAPGARVVSHAFHMGDWAPDSVAHVGSGAARATVWLWFVPAEIDGFWEMEMEVPGGARRFVLELEQRFQEVSGAFRRGGSEAGRVTGSVRGEVARFQVENRAGELWRFVGRLAGESIVGTYRGPGIDGVLPWRASRFSTRTSRRPGPSVSSPTEAEAPERGG